MIYVNLNSLRPGQSGFDSTITHELQHMAQLRPLPESGGLARRGRFRAGDARRRL